MPSPFASKFANLFKSSKPARHRHIAYLENILGTSLEVQIVSSIEASGVQAEVALLAEIDRLEVIFNAYNPLSELSKWQSTFQQDVAISSELAQVLGEAEQWRRVTNGAFNPAVESLTRLWKEHESSGQPTTPQEIAPLVAQMNGSLWKVDFEKCIARRTTQLAVTLNSIAKGFIIDQACLAATQIEGVTEVLINIGGDIRHFGTKAVNVAIADPHNDAENAVPADKIALWNGGLATSGNYRRGFRVGERWFSHLLDPRTGWPVEATVGVSVFAESASRADVLATAFSVLLPKESIELADSLEDVGVLLIAADGIRTSNSLWKTRSRPD